MKRRDFIKRAGAAGVGFALLPTGFRAIRLGATPQGSSIGVLSDPALQPKFAYDVPDAMAPGFIFQPDRRGRYKIKIGPAIHNAGLVDPLNNNAPLSTPIWGYADQKDRIFTWPGRTFQVQSGPGQTEVVWANALDGITQHLLPVDTNLHWCYSLPGYDTNTIAANGVPIITHLHGGHTDFQFDGNPEFFYSPAGVNQAVGPQWANVPGGFTTKFRYDNNVPAGNLWYHDHALGITRLNVYAGLAGFYFVRDQFDTGKPDNPLKLPAWPYEKAYAIQDRMFTTTGALFYPAFPLDPFYADFIDGEGAVLPPGLFPGGGPTALAEFFGDHMVVNGIIWPKENVEPRNYRLHLLNGTDSRFMVIRFRVAATPASTDLVGAAAAPLPFTVIGSDQGLGNEPKTVTQLVFEPGSRYDIIIDFSDPLLAGQRIIMENLGGDAPFGGDFGGDLDPDADFFPNRQTDRIMAFDVVKQMDTNVPDVTDLANTDFTGFGPRVTEIPNQNGEIPVRQVALFEGVDEFGRLQPLLGANTGTPAAPVWSAIPWHMPTTENPANNSTEIWEVYNFTGDAHPVHLHLVHFEIIGRKAITFDAADGGQIITQHNGATGLAPGISNVVVGGDVILGPADGYVENTPKDMVTALPQQVTIIKATFDKPGRYVWHCHILSHEDHEMMRVLHVGPLPVAAKKDQLAGNVTAVLGPSKFALQQNYPNPFNPSTRIVFELPKESRVKLTVYDIRGREVRTLINNTGYGAGRHSVVWDGKNKFGRDVASGVYIYRIKAGSYSKALKMNLIR